MKLLSLFAVLGFASFVSLAKAADTAPEKTPATPAAPKDRPNIIFLLTDDMGYGDPGCYGGKFAPTPNIDHLCQEGTRFQQYYVDSPLCSPSRTALLTGMFPARWNITNYLQTRAGNRASECADFLDPKAPSIARTLKAAGYTTGHFGKWHMGGGRDVTEAPKFSEYGFDEHISTFESPEPDPDITSTHWIWAPSDKVKRWDRTRYFIDKALDFLSRHKGEPCYVNIWPDDVHTPWVPSQERLAEYPEGPSGPEDRRSFSAVLDEYDRQVGRLLTGLKQLGLEENTILIFSSDNGPMPSFQHARTAGLRGCKDSLYEGGTREPFIVRWPGHIPAGRFDQKTVIHGADLFPTLCAFAGAQLPAGIPFDGEDMSPSILGQSQTRHRPIFWEYGRNTNKAFAYPGGKDRSPNVAVREGSWKLLVNADATDAQLYNLDSDPHETTNVAYSEPETATRLKQMALEWRKGLPVLEAH